MALIPNYTSLDRWALGFNTPSIYYNLGIFNNLNVKVRIDKFYILNKISNPQEAGHLRNFVIYFRNLQYFGGLSNDAMEDIQENNNYTIPYPPYYSFSPGNINDSPIFQQQGVFAIPAGPPNDDGKYRTRRSFVIPDSKIFSFALEFGPPDRKIDFFKADLVCEYTKLDEQGNDNGTGILKNEIRGELVSTVDEIDTKNFPQLVFSVNGIDSNNILTIQ
tara:strand:+ start:4700 stop:5356 length:657 start_codon:yes stop_codon:yes gene_type:complete